MFLSKRLVSPRLGKVAPAVLLILPFFVSTAGAAVFTNVSCSGLNGSQISSESSCVIDSGAAQGNALAFYSVSGNVLTTSMSGSAIAGPSGYAAVMDGFIGINLSTAGPVRPGVVQVLAGYNGFPFFPGGNASGTDEWNLTTTNLVQTCDVQSCFDGDPSAPIVLGSVIQFGQSMQLQASGDDFSPAAVSGDLAVALQFFEADGVTPVAVFVTPEPAALPLVAAGLAALLAAKLRHVSGLSKRSSLFITQSAIGIESHGAAGRQVRGEQRHD